MVVRRDVGDNAIAASYWQQLLGELRPKQAHVPIFEMYELISKKNINKIFFI